MSPAADAVGVSVPADAGRLKGLAQGARIGAAPSFDLPAATRRLVTGITSGAK
jgi:hypothetical protein